MAHELDEAIKKCPPWLMQRISVQARNLLMLHRLEGATVSPKTANTLLVAMGVLVAEIIFEEAKKGYEDAEALELAHRQKIYGTPEAPRIALMADPGVGCEGV